MDGVVHTCARIEAAVQTAVGIEPCDALAVCPLNEAGMSAEEHFSVRLLRHGKNEPVRERIRIKRGIHAAIGLQAANSADHLSGAEVAVAGEENFSIRLKLNRFRIHTAAGFESRVPAAVLQKSSEPRRRPAATGVR